MSFSIVPNKNMQISLLHEVVLDEICSCASKRVIFSTSFLCTQISRERQKRKTNVVLDTLFVLNEFNKENLNLSL